MATKKKSSKTPKKRSAVRETGAAIPGGSQSKQPRAMRPVVPESYAFPTGPKGMLNWDWARDRLTKSKNYVVVTVRPDSRPHVMGMHGLWWDDEYYFGTSSSTRKAKNLKTNPHCALISEDMNELVIVEGVAEKVSYEQLPVGISEASKKKYGWPMNRSSGGSVYKLTPRVVFAFPLKQIATAVTKWVFD